VLTKAELQRLRSLREKKNREALGLFVIEGEKVVGELLAAGFPFTEIYVTEEWPGPASLPLPAANGEMFSPPPSHLLNPSTALAGHESSLMPAVPITSVSADEMARASHYPTPSTVLAVAPLVRQPLAPGVLTRGLTLALDGVQDAGNVGTLLRIADWFGFDRVLLTPDCADLFHQKVIGASMGSFARVAVHTVDLPHALAEVAAPQSGSIPILGCDLEGDDVHALPAMSDAIVVIGSEGRGLSPAVAARITRRITIPRYLQSAKSGYGGAESLNAAVAAAIVCDNLRRARGHAG
jgi:RNA methyltransferase, TrmH family